MNIQNVFVLLSLVFLVAGCGKAPRSATPEELVILNAGPNPYADKPFVMGVLGDSIAAGTDIKTFLGEDVEFNWATGEALTNSLVNTFRKQFRMRGWKVNTQSRNLAVVGQRVYGLKSNLQATAVTMATHNPDYVTIQVGANDVCHGNLDSELGVAAFRQSMITTLQSLKSAQRPPKVITILSIPDIYKLAQIPALRDSFYCQAVWLYACPRFQIGEAGFYKELNAANDALKEAAEASGSTVHYDNGSQMRSNFTESDVSKIDCFHPSVIGHTKMAADVWNTFQTATQPIFSSN